MKKLFLILIVWFGNLSAQDPNTSLLYSVPTAISPTMAGLVEGKARFAFSHRLRRATDHVAYNTSMFCADVPFAFNQNVYGSQGSRGGASLLASTDFVKGMNTTQFQLSGAYEVPLGVKTRYHHIRGGFQAGLIQRKLVQPDLYYEDQYDGTGFTLPTSEEFANNSKMNFDAAIGAMWYRTQKIKGNPELNPWLGFSVHHITRPNLKFTYEKAERLSLRYTVHGGVKFRTRSPFDANLNLLYVRQNNSNSINISLFGRWVFYERNVWFSDEKADLMVGSVIRPGESVAFYVSSSFLRTYTVGFGYDLLTNKNKKLPSNAYGGFQFMISYLLGGKDFEKSYLPYPIF